MLIGLVLVLLVLVVFLVPKPSDHTPQIEQSRMDGRSERSAWTHGPRRWSSAGFGVRLVSSNRARTARVARHPASAGSIGKLPLRRMIDWVETTELNPPVPSLAGHLQSAICYLSSR